MNKNNLFFSPISIPLFFRNIFPSSQHSFQSLEESFSMRIQLLFNSLTYALFMVIKTQILPSWIKA